MGAKLEGTTLRLMARNCYQVLGKDLETPSEFIICWTKDGQATGGTGQALRIAKKNNIPVFNLYNPDATEQLKDYIRRHR